MSAHRSLIRAKNAIRNATKLEARIEKKLVSYAAFAGAAGVSALALAHPTEAEVIFTATHQVIGANATFNLDVNNDGITDFTVSNFYFVGTSIYQGANGHVSMLPGFGNQVVATSNNSVAALPLGYKIGAKDKFGGNDDLETCHAALHSYFRDGQWLNVKNKFIGLKFTINGQTHFGWARLTVRQATFCQSQVLLTGYAYEDVANMPIAAGKTSGTSNGSSPELHTSHQAETSATLAGLALGVAGFTFWGERAPTKNE